MHKIIHITGMSSIVIQILTMVIDSYVLFLPTKTLTDDFKYLLAIENVVNFIELSFYAWMLLNFSAIKNITKFRYYDWVITTPTMLFTYIMYLNINKKKQDAQPSDFFSLVSQEKYTIAGVVGLNCLMLFFGYLGEIGKIKPGLSTALGFVPFLAMFYIIYTEYAQFTSLGQSTFMYFVSVWALYGVAALLSYKVKNVMYNVLDLFAKNFFGLFLAYTIVFG